MKHQIATTPEQSKRLLACGLNYKTADMTLSFCNDSFYELMATPFHYGCFTEKDAPAWSLSALLALLPTSLTSAMGNKYMLELSKLRMHNAWEVQWFNGRERWRTVDKDKKYHKLWDESPIEACVRAIEYLTANGYTLNTK